MAATVKRKRVGYCRVKPKQSRVEYVKTSDSIPTKFNFVFGGELLISSFIFHYLKSIALSLIAPRSKDLKELDGNKKTAPEIELGE